MDLKLLLELVGFYMLITGFFDAYKYHWQSQSIRKAGIAKGHSRKFINTAIHNDHVRVLYLFLMYLVYGRMDWFLMFAAIIATIFMTELWFTIYWFYPYRYRGLYNFKRPNVYVYFINSLLPNKYRRRL